MLFNKLHKFLIPLVIITVIAMINSCDKDPVYYNDGKASKRIERKTKPANPKDSLSKPATDSTENIILIVVDGARYVDTWETYGTPLIPNRKAMAKEGALCASFYNNGLTLTVSGHTAIATGIYETLNNAGAQTPSYPSYLQAWRKAHAKPANKAWIITSKDKLEVIKNCTEPKWKDLYNPLSNCGNEGLGTGYRDDFITLNKVKEVLSIYTPNLMLINLKQPDMAGHSGDSLAYVQGIIDSDYHVKQLWDFIQSNEHYKNKTTLIITNDHGRHSPGNLDGFKSHGDNCAGCRHIEFLGLGPAFKKNYISTTAYSQIDIAPTIAYLMGFKMPFGNGKVMKDLLVE
jgi:predicted AlkP superfamily pyrophosphatase or phosphodiesterase